MSKVAVNQKANEIVRNHVAFSLGAGLVPIPGLDALGVIAIQVDMLRQLADNYRLPFSKEAGKSCISAVAGGSLARFGASSVLKLIPGVGSIVGGVTMSAMSGASTYAIGQVFKQHFSAGGTLDSFDPDRAKKVYEEELEKGKDVAEKIAKEEKNKEAGGNNTELEGDVYQKLEKLAELRTRKIISEEDFQKQKERLLNSI